MPPVEPSDLSSEVSTFNDQLEIVGEAVDVVEAENTAYPLNRDGSCLSNHLKIADEVSDVAPGTADYELNRFIFGLRKEMSVFADRERVRTGCLIIQSANLQHTAA